MLALFRFLVLCSALERQFEDGAGADVVRIEEAPPTQPTAAESASIGLNFDLRHCEGPNDVDDLFHSPNLPLPDDIKTHVDVRIDELRGKVLFTVTVPYLAYNVHYTLDFVDGARWLHEAYDRCSSDYRRRQLDVRSPSDDARWRHAPNAAYGGAFSSPEKYATYFIDEQSYWKPRARGCSHIIYEAEFALNECATFRTPTSNDDDSLRQFSGVLRVKLTRSRLPSEAAFTDLTELEARVHFARYTEFELYVDRSNNKVLLATDIVPGQFKAVLSMVQLSAITDRSDSAPPPRAAVEDYKYEKLLIQISASQPLLVVSNTDAAADFVLQSKVHLMLVANVDQSGEIFKSSTSTESSSYSGSGSINNDDSSINDEGFEFSVDDDDSTDGRFHDKSLPKSGLLNEDDDDDDVERRLPYVNVLYADGESSDSFDGRFTLLFRNNASEDAPFTAHLSLFVAAPRKFSLKNAPLRIETAHVANVLSEFNDTRRVCMQTYVVAHEAVTRVLQIELLRAQLCSEQPVEQAINSKQCITLYDIALPKDNKRHNVTLKQPGAYGPASVIVCFNADDAYSSLPGDSPLLRTTVEDDETRLELRYHSTVRFLAANTRKHYTLTLNSDNDMFSILDDAVRQSRGANHRRKHLRKFQWEQEEEEEEEQRLQQQQQSNGAVFNGDTRKRSLFSFNQEADVRQQRRGRQRHPGGRLSSAARMKSDEFETHSHLRLPRVNDENVDDDEDYERSDGERLNRIPIPLTRDNTAVGLAGVFASVLIVFLFLFCVHRMRYDQLGE